MKILSVGNFGRSWDGSICDEEHIAQALEKLGHEVVRWSREMTQYFPADAEYKNADFALIAQYDGYPTDLFDKLHRLQSRRIVYWAFDYQADGQEWHERLVGECDVYLSKRLADSKYPNWHWLPQDFAPDFLYAPPHMDEKDIDVLFTGSHLPWATERTELLKAVDREFNLTVYSFTTDAWKADGLKNVNGPIMDGGLPQLINRAKINISIDHTIEAGYWSDRNAQLMACGGFVLSRYVPMAEMVFGDKIVYFYNMADCLEKIRHYLDDEFEREHMATVGYDHAQSNLMVGNRVKQMLTIVGAYL